MVEPVQCCIDVTQRPLGGHGQGAADLSSGLVRVHCRFRGFRGQHVDLVQPEASFLLEFLADARQMTSGHQGCPGGPGSGLDLVTHLWFVLPRSGLGAGRQQSAGRLGSGSSRGSTGPGARCGGCRSQGPRWRCGSWHTRPLSRWVKPHRPRLCRGEVDADVVQVEAPLRIARDGHQHLLLLLLLRPTGCLWRLALALGSGSISETFGAGRPPGCGSPMLPNRCVAIQGLRRSHWAGSACRGSAM